MKEFLDCTQFQSQTWRDRERTSLRLSYDNPNGNDESSSNPVGYRMFSKIVCLTARPIYYCMCDKVVEKKKHKRKTWFFFFNLKLNKIRLL